MIQTEHRIDQTLALRHLKQTPLLELGQKAFREKRARYGDRVTFVHNRHVNPTNLCVYSCKFCDYAAKKNDAHAYELTEAEILRDIEDPSIVEAHIVGGLWPSWHFQRSLDLVKAIRAARCPRPHPEPVEGWGPARGRGRSTSPWRGGGASRCN